MLPDRVSNPEPLTYESGALPIALRGLALNLITMCPRLRKCVVVVVLLFYVHGKHLRSCRDGQLT